MTRESDRRQHLITARLYLIVTVRDEGGWLIPVEAALSSGCVDIVQLRDRSGDDAVLIERAHELRELAHANDALFVLNDRPELVTRVEADGAHVGEDDIPVAEARAAIGPERILGTSTHDADEIRAARELPVDYVGLGPMYPTSSKTLARAPGGGALVAGCLPAAGSLPVFPIGGITPENAPALVSAGAKRLAVGAGILRAADPAAAARDLAALLDDDKAR